MSAFAVIVFATAIAVMVGILIWAAFNDLRFYLIPNRVPVAVAAAYGAIAGFLPWSFVLSGLVTAAVVLALGILIFARGWMGGGDIKLLAALALWAGPSLLPLFGLVTSLAGAVLAALMLSPMRRFLPMPSADALEFVGADGAAIRQPMPFGVPISIGGLALAAFYLHAIG